MHGGPHATLAVHVCTCLLSHAHGIFLPAEKHVVRGNILVSCALLGCKVHVELSGRTLSVIEDEAGKGGEDLRPCCSKPTAQYRFQVWQGDHPQGNVSVTPAA